MRKLVISGAITTDQYDYQILSEQKNLYCNLYKTKAEDMDSIKSFLNNISTCILQLFDSEGQKLSCECQISIEECKRTLANFLNQQVSLKRQNPC